MINNKRSSITQIKWGCNMIKAITLGIIFFLAITSLCFGKGSEWQREYPWVIKLAPPECKSKVGVSPDLIYANPYDTEGKCYLLHGGFKKQYLNKSQALYFYFYASRDTHPVMVDFGNVMIPADWQAYAIGVGVYKYEAVSGSQNIIPAVKIIKIVNPQRELAY